MKTRRTNQYIARWMVCLALAFLSTGLATTAQALTWDFISPTVCKSSSRSFLSDNRIEFEGTRIGVDESASIWDYDIVVCPISRFRPGQRLRYIHIGVAGGTEIANWCRLYESPDHDTVIAHRGVSVFGNMQFNSPTSSTDDGRVGLTAECLLTPGAVITDIRLSWD